MKTKTKHFFASALLIFISLFLAFLVGEIALRFTDYRYLLNKAYGFPKGYFMEDKEMGVDYAPNFAPQIHEFYGPTYEVSTNSLGCFDTERPVPKDYAVVLGGSTAWGYAPLEQMWTSVLEQKLGWTVLKCAVTGTGTKEQLLKLQKLKRQIGHGPKMVIVLYDAPTDVNDDWLFPISVAVQGCRLNSLKSMDLETGVITRQTEEEIQDQYKKKGHKVCRASPKRSAWKRVTQQFSKSLLLNIFKEYVVPHIKFGFHQVADKGEPKMYAPYGNIIINMVGPEKSWMVEALNLHKRNLRDLAIESLKDGGSFLIIDENDGLTKYDVLKDAYQALTHTPRVYYYNLYTDLQALPAGEYAKYRWKFDPHWNKDGNALVAEYIYRFLRQNGLNKPLNELPR